MGYPIWADAVLIGGFRLRRCERHPEAFERYDESGAVALRITSAGLAVIDAADKAIAAPEESGSGLSSAGEAITSRKRISVFAQTSARRRHRSGKAKTQTGCRSLPPRGPAWAQPCRPSSGGHAPAGPATRRDWENSRPINGEDSTPAYTHQR